MDFGAILTSILILVGVLLMVLSAFSIRRLILLLRGTRYLRDWRVLRILILFFLAGYLISLVVSIADRMEILAVLSGVIFVFGALFVLGVVHLGQRTLADLLKTTVSKDYVENILKAIPDMVIVANENFEIKSANQDAVKACGFSENEWLHLRLPTVFPEYAFDQMDCTASNVKAETVLITKDNRQIPVSLAITTLIGENCKIKNLVCLAKDITEQKQVEKRLEHVASHDSLTSLANRSMLLERLEIAIEQAANNPKQCYGVLFIDLDHFKDINDQYGHLVGDQLLTAVARRLENCIRYEDLVGRMGGDEFVVLLTTIQSIREVEITARRVLENLLKPFEVSGYLLRISGSIGYLIGSPAMDEAADVLRYADQALYQAKSAGRDCAKEFAGL